MMVSSVVFRRVAALAVLTLFMVTGGCTRQFAARAATGGTRYELITLAPFDTSARGVLDTLHATAYQEPQRPVVKRPSTRRNRDKLHPLLRSWLRQPVDKAKRRELVVTFRDTIRVPRFPEPDPQGVVDSVATQALIDSLIAVRAPQHSADSAHVDSVLEGIVIKKYWLIQAQLISLPLGAVDDLQALANVVYIQPRETGTRPPQCSGAPDIYAICGREFMGSDYYMDSALGKGQIGLLDTGVRFSHELLMYRRLAEYDCVGGCRLTSAGDLDALGHGTATAAIMSAKTAESHNRGVTGAMIRSYRVYDATLGLDTDAVLDAFQFSITRGDRLLVAEMQDSGPAYGPVAQAADQAFGAGAVIIAANGNKSEVPLYSVGSPASARRAIGVGAVLLKPTGGVDLDVGQAYARTYDHRPKPDLQCLTQTITAGNRSDTDLQKSHTGTSGSTPYAAGTALLLRNWIRLAQVEAGGSPVVYPGQVNGALILSGEFVGSFDDAAKLPTGSGPIRVPTNGWGAFGKVTITATGSQVRFVPNFSAVVPDGVPGGTWEIAAAIWWPERLVIDAAGGMVDTHNNIDLALISDGTIASKSVYGVFERVSKSINNPGGGAPTGWSLLISGTTVRLGPQDVYWAAAAIRKK